MNSNLKFFKPAWSTIQRNVSRETLLPQITIEVQKPIASEFNLYYDDTMVKRSEIGC